MSRHVRALLAVALLLTAGCLGSGPPPSDPAAERAVSRAVNASTDVTDYRVAGTGRAELTNGDRAKTVRFSRQTAVNRTARRGRVTVRSRGENETGYLAPDGFYVPCYSVNVVNRPDAWHAAIPIRNNWTDHDPLGIARRTLAGSSVQYEGAEAVRGRDAVVVVAHPTGEALDALKRQFEATSDAGVGRITSVTVRAWIGNETGRLLRTESVVESTKRSATLTQHMTLAYEYGGNVSVSLPERLVDSEGDCPGP